MADRILGRSLTRRVFLKGVTAGLATLALPGRLFQRARASEHELPLILIGPILRRVEPRSVSVFVATSQPATIELLLYEGVGDAANLPSAKARQDRHTMQFGVHFHATVVTVNLDETEEVLAPGTRYWYDLKTTPDGGTARSLLDLELLKDSQLPGYGRPEQEPEPVEVNALGYRQGELPSFVTCPITLDELVLAHTSCRKPHGAGRPALQHLDEYLDDLDGADAGWIHMLFLTGDQIYADDVATALLPGVTALGIDLISGRGGEVGVEEVPRPDDASTGMHLNSTVLPGGFRQKLTATAMFTSREAESHLIGFGEFLAMYCAAWNPEMWPLVAIAEIDPPNPNNPDDVSKELGELQDDLRADASVSPEDAPVALKRLSPDAPTDLLTPLYDRTDPAVEAQLETGKRFLREKAHLDVFRREVPKVRRLLANVPTYMLADDHEITDDWFMTGKIRAETTGNPFGLALHRNALAAFTICQAWGNDPDSWTAEQNQTKLNLLEAIAGMFGGSWGGGLPGESATRVDEALGLLPNTTPQFDFSFSVEGPVHKVRALDTRTRRRYDRPDDVPGLLTSAALDDQLPEETLQEGHILVLVSPAPVFGPQVISELGGPLQASIHDIKALLKSESDRAAESEVTGFEKGRPTGKEAYEAEHWSVHPAEFERLLDRLSHFPRVVVLGGDVHYGAAFTMDWRNDKRTSRIIHFTASAARNEWTGGNAGAIKNLVLFNGLATGLQGIGLPMTRLGWDESTTPVIDEEDETNEANLKLEPPLTRLALHAAPLLLSNELFRAHYELARTPDWMWRAERILDERPSAERPEGARVTIEGDDLPDDEAALEHYGRLVSAHVDALDKYALGRSLQFLNNVGIVRFARSDGALRVEQSLYSLRPRPGANEEGAAYIVHAATLEPESFDIPTAVGPGA